MLFRSIVTGAEPRGRYGNWIEIEHSGGISTVYGHLSEFVPGIAPGRRVRRGDVIGFVGTTGRTTGPHVHFEVLVNGRPIDPAGLAGPRRTRLSGADLASFLKVVARDRTERAQEEKTR